LPSSDLAERIDDTRQGRPDELARLQYPLAGDRVEQALGDDLARWVQRPLVRLLDFLGDPLLQARLEVDSVDTDIVAAT
jgi:hypothetical protein